MIKPVSLLLLAAAFATTGCKTQVLASASESDELIRRAEQEVRLALHTGFIWSDTEARLAEAKAARTAGDLNNASRLARVAIDEAAQAQLQARAATKVKRDFTYRP